LDMLKFMLGIVVILILMGIALNLELFPVRLAY